MDVRWCTNVSDSIPEFDEEWDDLIEFGPDDVRLPTGLMWNRVTGKLHPADDSKTSEITVSTRLAIENYMKRNVAYSEKCNKLLGDMDALRSVARSRNLSEIGIPGIRFDKAAGGSGGRWRVQWTSACEGQKQENFSAYDESDVADALADAIVYVRWLLHHGDIQLARMSARTRSGIDCVDSDPGCA